MATIRGEGHRHALADAVMAVFFDKSGGEVEALDVLSVLTSCLISVLNYAPDTYRESAVQSVLDAIREAMPEARH